MTTYASTRKRCEIVRRGVLKQKWYARFIADNGLRLARTTEHYHNLGDLKAMLAKYFPDWPVVVLARTKEATDWNPDHPAYDEMGQ